MSKPASVDDAIVAADQTFTATFNRGDAAGVAAPYTEDAEFLPPHDFVTGRSAIQAAFQVFMDMGAKAMQLDALKVEEYGDTATEVGHLHS